MAKKKESKDFLDRIAAFNLHFGRFASDIGGVLFLAFALITLLALFGWTQGKLIVIWKVLFLL